MNKKNTKLIIKISIFTFLFIAILISKTFITKVTESNEENYTTLSSSYFPAIVSKVIDGDTVEIFFTDTVPENCNIEERVRMIGINTPEMNLHKKTEPEYFAKEATEFTENELLNENVNIQLDSITGLRDKYGRLLCYIYIDKYLFNEVLVEKGYAKYYDTFPFEKSKADYIKNAEKYAKENKNGLWK